jgi:hypothetical protein
MIFYQAVVQVRRIAELTYSFFYPSLSLMIPVKYTLSNGFLPLNSYPAIIILATQKKMISGPVTNVFVG